MEMPRVAGRRVVKQAHRLVYEHLVGDPGENLHHQPTCPKRCVNPEHLTPMTISAHVVEHKTRETCIHGHPLSEAYTVRRSNGRVTRMCAQCSRDNQKRINARKRENEARQRVHLTEPQKDEVRRLRLAGEPVNEIAERYGVSTVSVYRLTKDMAIPRVVPATTRPDRSLSSEMVRMIRSRAATGATYKSIAADVGVTAGHIGHIVNRNSYRDVV